MVLIIGAGISGLSVAWQLQKLNIPCRILEAEMQPGGVIRTKKRGPYLLEEGPNSLMSDAHTMTLLEEIGLKDKILLPNEVSKSRYVFKKGRYRKLPGSPTEMIFSSFLSFKAKRRIFGERSLPAQDIPNETLSAFTERRFGKEVVDYALNPFVSGIYAGDPDELLLDETFPFLKEYERDYGSVIKGMKQNSGSARRQSLSFRDGMQTLTDKMAETPDIFYGTKVLNIRKSTEGKGFTVRLSNGKEHQAEQVVLSVPAYYAAEMIREEYPEAAEAFADVDYSPMTVVHSAFNRKIVNFRFDGFGALHPKKENLFTAGSIWSSSIFEGRAPRKEILLTTFVGGTLYKENAMLPDDALSEHTNAELTKRYDIFGTPSFQQLTRWDKALPQYNKKIKVSGAAVEKPEQDGLFVSANWHKGVAIGDILKKGKKLAETISRVRG